MNGTVYILRNKQNKLYIGSTNNLERRLRQHKNGCTQTTKNMGNVELALKQNFPDLKIARKIEANLKKLKRKDYLEKIINDGFIKMSI